MVRSYATGPVGFIPATELERDYQTALYSLARFNANAERANAYRNQLHEIPGAIVQHDSGRAFLIEFERGCPAGFHPSYTSPAIYAHSLSRKSTESLDPWPDLDGERLAPPAR